MLRPIHAFSVGGLLLAGCAHPVQPVPSVPPHVRARELFEVDRAFSRMAAEQGAAAAFGRFSDQRSLRLNPVGPNTVGRAAFMAELAGVPPGALSWAPQFSEAALSGDLGWTWGDYVLRSPEGERHGRYVTVWRMTPEGWRIAADIGTQEQPRQ